MGRTGAATSMPINAITTVSAVNITGLTSIHWILLLPLFALHSTLSTTHSKYTQLKLLQNN